MKPAPASQALAAAKNLHAGILALQDAVAACQRNRKLMQEIASTVGSSSPMLRCLLARAGPGGDADVDAAVATALNTVVEEVLRARRAAFTWLLTNPAARLLAGGHGALRQALLAVKHFALAKQLSHLERLQASAAPPADGRELERDASGDRWLGCRQAAVEAVVAQLHGLVQHRRQHSTDTVTGMAKDVVTAMAKDMLEDKANRGQRLLRGHGGSVCAVAWSPDGSTLASGSEDGATALWHAGIGQRLQVLQGHSSEVTTVAWSADGGSLATGSRDGSVVLWDGNTGQQLRVLKAGDSAGVNTVAWSPDGRTLAAGYDAGKVVIWDGSSGQQVRVLEGHGGCVKAVAWSPDGRALATGSGDTTVVLWDSSTWQQLRVLPGHRKSVNAVAWHPSKPIVATGSDDKSVALWDSSSGQQLHLLKGCTAKESSRPGYSAIGPGGHILTSTYWVTEYLDDETGLPTDGERHSDAVLALAWSPDGKTLASLGPDLRCAKLLDGGELRPWWRGSDELYGDCCSLAWSPDGATLAAGMRHGPDVVLWDARWNNF